MIIIDTNVITELFKPGRSQKVVDWLDDQVVETLYMTATSFAEIRLGLDSFPAGKKKKALSFDVNAVIAHFFGERILPFDKTAAVEYGLLLAASKSAGRTVSVSDGQIGAIAKSRSFLVATRDTTPFESMGVPFINPWKV